ncbi:JAB domain-containing protein [Xanthomonas hydrangeae]|uniref:JAB domain-containing protein n=1 Tax=Xanthomonas hydrangeae TaxID=2775159 RepID=UPI003CE484AB
MDEGASPRTGTSMRIHLRRCAGLTPARQRRRPAGCCPLAQPVADRKLIERLQQSPDLLDIGALDHLIIGGRKNVSLAARGWGRPPFRSRFPLQCRAVLARIYCLPSDQADGADLTQPTG